MFVVSTVISNECVGTSVPQCDANSSHMIVCETVSACDKGTNASNLKGEEKRKHA